MEKPLIHPASDQTLSLLLGDLPQSLLLTGPEGVGLATIAKYIASYLHVLPIIVLPEKDEKVDLQKGTITVDVIRKLYNQTRTIESGKRIIIIDYAERMAVAAQNTFLKLLEEPGEGTYFILATHSPSKLLPTITSRTVLLELRPITHTQSEVFLETLGHSTDAKRTQLLYIADGLPAEIYRLTHSDIYFADAVQIVRDARDLLQSTTYAKLRIAQTYKDNREGTLSLLMTVANILKRSISEKPQASLIAQIDDVLLAHQQIKANGNIRLCLARFVL
jgi:replication-associated recombination protein RarA